MDERHDRVRCEVGCERLCIDIHKFLRWLMLGVKWGHQRWVTGRFIPTTRHIGIGFANLPAFVGKVEIEAYESSFAK